MKVCFFDTETNGLDFRINQITEVGAIKYDYIDKKWFKISEFSELVWDETYPPQPEMIVELTGIDDATLKTRGLSPSGVFQDLVHFLADVDVMVAHEANFDKCFLAEAVYRHQLEMPQKEWLCTKRNFDWPTKYTCHRLTHLALENFIEFKMRDMHRATADCDLLQQLISLYDFDKALEYAREPFIIIAAKIRGPWQDGGVQNGIAKSLGFSWEKLADGTIFKKSWVRRIKKSALKPLTDRVLLSSSPFEITMIHEQEIK